MTLPENTPEQESTQEPQKDSNVETPKESSLKDSAQEPQKDSNVESPKTSAPEPKPANNERREARQKRFQRLLSYFGYPGSGIGLAATINFLKNGQWREAIISVVITIFLLFLAIGSKFIKNLISKILDKIEERLEQHEDKFAEYIVNQLETSIVKSWWRLTSSFQREYYQSLIYTCRDYQTQGLDKDRILKLNQVFVPLKVSNKEFTNVKSELIQNIETQSNDTKEMQIWDFLVSKDKYNHKKALFPRIAILGAPGSGKTTLLRHLTLTYANQQERKLHPKAPKLIPILLYLRDVRRQIIENQPPLAELITEQVKKERKIQPLNPPPNWFAEKLNKNKCLVMLDGLDEVADEKERKQVSEWVDEQMKAYPDTIFILTSRPFGYKTAKLQQEITVLEVQPFNLKQMQEFIHNWYLQTEIMSRAGQKDLGVQEEAKNQADDLIKRIRNSSPLAVMAVNPLLLTMIATVHRRGNALPGKRVELYKEICQVLLERRQRAKNIPNVLTASQKQSVLQILALELMQNNTREFRLSQVISLIEDKLITVAGVGANSAEFIR